MNYSDTKETTDYIAEQIRSLPNEALERLQYLQPQVGCFNSCSFCSQEAGNEIWQLTKGGLSSLFKAISDVAKEKNIIIAGKRENHRPGVIFPYLDNDISTYPYIIEYVRMASELLGVKIRVSTLGFSAESTQQSVHSKLVSDFKESFDGIRFSFTPYAQAYSKNSEQYILDIANSLKTYKPLVEFLGTGASTAAVELRFPPMVFSSKKQIFDEIIDGYHVIAVGPHSLIGKDKHRTLAVSRIVNISDRKAQLSTPPRLYTKVTDDAGTADPAGFALQLIEKRNQGFLFGEEAELYLWKNNDGPYYAINPFPANDGKRRDLQIFPMTDKRLKAGYINSARPFLEALITYKASKGLSRKSQYHRASWDDVNGVIDLMKEMSASLAKSDRGMSKHIQENVITLVQDYAKALKLSGYAPQSFFDPNWTIDTGTIVNQGKARPYFKGLTNSEDDPMSINEERGYGNLSISSQRGTVWRIAPMPSSEISISSERFTKTKSGNKNQIVEGSKVIVEELDPQHLRPYMKETGQPLRRFVIDGIEIEHHGRRSSKNMNNYPGAKNEQV
jgi:hypothetical protein